MTFWKLALYFVSPLLSYIQQGFPLYQVQSWVEINHSTLFYFCFSRL